MLPHDAGYLWRYLPHHLKQAERLDELAELVCDLRWVEAKTSRFGSVVAVQADLMLVDTPIAAALRAELDTAAHPLGPTTTGLSASRLLFSANSLASGVGSSQLQLTASVRWLTGLTLESDNAQPPSPIFSPWSNDD